MSDSDERNQKFLSAMDDGFRLVGRFMFRWAYLETRITEAVKTLFKLRGPEANMILANITFRDKTAMVQTIVDYYSDRKSDIWRKNARRVFTDMTDLNQNYRNILAHNSFIPNDGEEGGIEIRRIKAKGKYEVPKILWTRERFRELDDELNRLNDRLKEVVDEVVHQISVTDLARAMAAQRPTPVNALLGLLGDPRPQPPDTQDSDQSAATPKKDQKKRQAPPEKEGKSK